MVNTALFGFHPGHHHSSFGFGNNHNSFGFGNQSELRFGHQACGFGANSPR
jgi:hypothetical protein